MKYFTKQATVKLTDDQMREVLFKTHYTRYGDPNMFSTKFVRRDSGPDLKKRYRRELSSDPHMGFDVPIEKRLEIYKHYKKTGKLPDVHINYKGNDPVLKIDYDHQLDYTPSKNKMQLVSGTRDVSAKKVLEYGPATTLDRAVLLPGQTKAQQLGLYAVKPSDVNTAGVYCI